MLSRRDKLLIRPWEQKRYENHLRKIQTALPVIDNSPPQTRFHVLNKSKKQQKETERCAKIQNDNLILLRKMNYIMRTSRVDNYWTKPPPNFLNRVSMYDEYYSKPIRDVEIKVEMPINRSHLRKSKCPACTPIKLIDPLIPEERIPWEPPKGPVSRKRSKSVPPMAKPTLPIISEKQISIKPRENLTKSKSSDSQRSKSSIPKTNNKRHIWKYNSVSDCFTNPQCIVLTRGCLKLSVNFPSDTQVKLQEGLQEKVLVKSGECFCATKAF